VTPAGKASIRAGRDRAPALPVDDVERDPDPSRLVNQ
jgi:hypothetical protein